MTGNQLYEQWIQNNNLDSDLRKELLMVKDDEKEIEDRFYKNLEFGTAGMRGLIGAGTNRMNIYTVRKAALGLAKYILEQGEVAKQRGVVIAYDSRHKSSLFALETARTIGNLGIKIYMFEDIRTTPELSFAVRYLHAFSGVVITASHNPSAYNGFKVYGQDGAQIASEVAKGIIMKIDEIDNPLQIEVSSVENLKEKELLTFIGKHIDEAYLNQVEKLTLNNELITTMAHDVSIVYTPLHGTGYRPVTQLLKRQGFKEIHLVEEQMQPDGDFPTVLYPNPEERTAFSLAIDKGLEQNADILLATDPDADRVGVAVLVEGEYKLLTGNQIGALLLQYILQEKERQGLLPENGVVLKSIVSSELGRKIAQSYQVETVDVLTGFKYIAEKIEQYEQTKQYQFLFGYEESYGYLIGDFVRDKDAVQTCGLIAEITAYYKSQGKTLYDALNDIYNTYGFFQEDVQSNTYEGKQGSEKINQILRNFRQTYPEHLANIPVKFVEDYHLGKRTYLQENRTDKITLPSSNVLKFILKNDAWVCIRPSGTEPKIKYYYGVSEATRKESEEMLHRLKKAIEEHITAIL